MSDDDVTTRAITAEFRAGLPKRIETMCQLIAAAKQGDAEALTQLGTTAHRLRGVCGSFAMNELAEPSRLIEMQCRTTPNWDIVANAIAELQRLVSA